MSGERSDGYTPAMHIANDDARQANMRDNLGLVDMSIRYEAQPTLPEPITSSLPIATRALVGRDRELQQILNAADRQRAVSIHAIDGMAGVGKTALAVRAAYELAARFPDGQFFVELDAYTPGRQAADPSDVLASLLIELGLDPRSIPDTLTGRRDLWRHRLANRKVLVILDDAANRDQIEPLLPSGPGCLTLITSRHRLLLLPDMQPLELNVLKPDLAAELFLTVARRSPEDRSERDVAARIAQLCGCLPLAIMLVAGRMAHHPDWTVAEVTELAQELEEATDRLTELDANDRIVRAAFDLSYQNLSPERQLLFRRLGLHPGPDVDAYVVVALVGVDLATAKRELGALHTDHHLDEPARGRYRLHDLLRDYARALVGDDPADDNSRAVDRLLDYYLRAAAHADRRVARRTRPTSDGDTAASAAAGGVVGQEFGDQMQALAWMRVERANLLAILEYTVDWDLARMIALTGSMAGLLDRDGPWSLAGRLHQRAAEAAQRIGDRRGEATGLTDLGLVWRLIGDYEQSADLLQQGLTIYQEIGDRLGQANALTHLGVVRRRIGDYLQAAALHEQGLTLYQEIGDGLGQANALTDLGFVLRETGDHERAASLHEQALILYRDLRNHLGEANALTDLGLVRREAGDYGQAATLHEQALTLYRDIRDRRGEAIALIDLGLVRREAGDYGQAATLYEQALTLYQEVGDRHGQAQALTGLGYVRRETGDYVQAADLLERALALNREIGSRHDQADTLGNLGYLHEKTGDYQRAAALHEHALTLYRGIGGRLGQAEELNGLGRVLLTTGKPGEALTAFTDALGLAREIGHHLQQARALDGAAHCRADLNDIPAAIAGLTAAVELYRRLGVPEADSAAECLAELESQF
ncbi:tetratricopeptide repeat protein [Nocardia sp. CS682]|uniref:ATP-binding protein n=1 Tax=Nocardia sp. CS682 TaxID=1047172 RepID=UPI0010757AEA|nr:tetratricopeptide repeat protein [Nocardia sp. CS682]QBS41319.1 transcriptional regulator [Nocardia sp. CS682]